MQDIRNAAKEQLRLQKRIDDCADKRDTYIGLANDLTGMYNGSLGTTRTILISALSSAYKGSIANALGLGVRQMLNMHGSSSLQSMIDSAISTANTYQGMIDYLYNNPTKLQGYASANSAMEAYMDGCTATDHFNAYHSSKSENPPDPPDDKATDATLPPFECPGACTNTYSTVWDALSDHHQKYGLPDDEEVSHLLDFATQQAFLAARDISKGQGCGVEWYNCDSDHLTKEAYHRVRTCNKYVAATRYFNYTGSQEEYRSHHCRDPFRRCMPHKDYHRWRTIKTNHDDHDPEGNDSSLSGKAYSESSSPIVSPDPPSTSADGTPDCPDCTSHCSSCSCTNSGTCNGTVTDNTPDCSYCTDGCSSCDSSTDDTPNCSDCTSHCSSPCSCSNSGTCDGTVVDNTPPTTPSTPPSPEMITCAAGHSYRADHSNRSYLDNLHRVRTCRFSGCGNSWQACFIDGWAPLCNNAYRKSQGWNCGAAE